MNAPASGPAEVIHALAALVLALSTAYTTYKGFKAREREAEKKKKTTILEREVKENEGHPGSSK